MWTTGGAGGFFEEGNKPPGFILRGIRLDMELLPSQSLCPMGLAGRTQVLTVKSSGMFHRVEQQAATEVSERQ
jgi:hypothetical protein